MDQKPKIVLVVGPTASGKTSLAIDLAKRHNGEVISADSRQVYRGLDIGTGKVTKEEMAGIPHHLIDVADPMQVFTADDYENMATEAIAGIIDRDKLPIVCGGTGFYVDLLCGRRMSAPVPPNQHLRLELEQKTLEELFAVLTKQDRERAATIDRYNRHRLVRALEIAHALGTVPKISPQESPYITLWLGIKLNDEELKQKIHQRLLDRFDQGMVSECERLHSHGVSWERMEELGLEYRYIARYLQQKLSEEEMRMQLQREIWQYAKRQKTWFKKNENIQWFTPEEFPKIEEVVTNFLS